MIRYYDICPKSQQMVRLYRTKDDPKRYQLYKYESFSYRLRWQRGELTFRTNDLHFDWTFVSGQDAISAYDKATGNDLLSKLSEL